MEIKYPVLEIFSSFQGEGRYQGYVCTFVRFAGCNLSCPWCDTAETMKRKSTLMTAGEIADKCKDFRVVFTGGEPLLYNLSKILDEFNGDKIVMLETNGTLPISSYDRFNYIACSPKPQSGYKIHSSITSLEKYGIVDYKYVVDSTLELENIRFPSDRKCQVYLQPEAFHQKESIKKAEKIIRYGEKIGYSMRLGIQAHRFWEVQ